jgi:hypothetical protein
MTELAAALESAALGKTAELYRRLELGSGLPGPRINTTLAIAFSQDCARLGARGDALAYRMATLPPDEARGASPKEFLSVCGVLAVATRAAGSKEGAVRDKALALLEDKADDPRFRVRDAVPLALATLGAKMGSELAERLASWMDRYFHAAAVLRALSDPAWLDTFRVQEHALAIGLLDQAFVLAHDAPRSAERYPGHKALVEVLGTAPRALVKRFGVPVFDQLALWAEGVKVPELRGAILANLEDAQLRKPFGAELKRIRDKVQASKKPPRDAARIVHGTRGRGKKHVKRS